MTDSRINLPIPQLRPRLLVLVGVFAIALASRLAPYLFYDLGIVFDQSKNTHWWNFSPILPVAIFGAAIFRRRELGLIAPLGLYLASDLLIWLISGNFDWAFYSAQPFVYLALLMVAGSGLLLRRDRSVFKLSCIALSSASVFFVISNFGVWITSGFYALTLEGLLECYYLALPFYRNTLLSMVIFLPILFSKFGVKYTTAPQLQPVTSIRA